MELPKKGQIGYPIDRASFNTKVKEFATFAETVFSGQNEALKNELIRKVNRVCQKRKLPSLSNDSRWLASTKGAKKKRTKVQLPDEIWIKILGFMKQKDVFRNFALTCKHFNKLSLDPSIIKSLYLRNIDQIDKDHVVKVLKRSRFLKKIEIRHCKSFLELLSTALEASQKLKSIIIEDYTNDPKQHEQFERILEKSRTTIEHLSLSGGGNGGLIITPATIEKLINLKKLHLHYDPELTLEDLEALAKNSKIESLHANISLYDDNDDPFNDADINSAFKTFFGATKKTLTDLKMIFDDLDDDFNMEWPKYLSMCQNLEKIEIVEYNSSNPNDIMTSISSLPKLRYLKLDDFENIQNINSFIENLNLDIMEELAFCRMEISMNSFMYLANRKCPNLKNICFYGCYQLKLDEEFLKKMISNCHKLEVIHISETKYELSDEQLYRLQQTGVVIGIEYERRRQVDKYVRYNGLPNARLLEFYACKCGFG